MSSLKCFNLCRLDSAKILLWHYSWRIRHTLVKIVEETKRHRLWQSESLHPVTYQNNEMTRRIMMWASLKILCFFSQLSILKISVTSIRCRLCMYLKKQEEFRWHLWNDQLYLIKSGAMLLALIKISMGACGSSHKVEVRSTYTHCDPPK